MKRDAPAIPSLRAGKDFQPGQVWRIGDQLLAVTLVGRILVHYKQYAIHRKATRTSLSSKTTLEALLLRHHAVLQPTPPVPVAPRPRRLY